MKATRENTRAMIPAAQRNAERPPHGLARSRSAANRTGSVLMLATVLCGATLASVPVFSYQSELSHIPQILAAGVLCMAVLTLFQRIPRIHPAVIAYVLLVAIWAATYRDWESYFTQVKVVMLAVAVHVIVRSPRQLLLVLGIFSASGAVALGLNWTDIGAVQESIGSTESAAAQERFAGTLSNPNTAGMYGLIVSLFALVVFFNTRNRLRWPLLVVSLGAGLLFAGLSGSRKAMVGILILAAATPLLALKGQRAELLLWGKRILLGLATIALAIAMLSQLPHFDRLAGLVEGGRDRSSETRMAMWQEAVRIWADHPLFGCGYDGFRRVSGFGTYSHTTFGEVLANGGFVGFLLISVFYIIPAVQLFRILIRGNHPELRRLAAGLLAFWVIFTMFSAFAVMLQSRAYIPICAAVCGFLQGQKPARHAFPTSKASASLSRPVRPVMNGVAST